MSLLQPSDDDYPSICELVKDDANAMSWEEDGEIVRLSELYSNIITQFESIVRNTTFAEDSFDAEIDELILRLRLWAADIQADSDTFDLLDNKYPEEAAAVRIHLENVSFAIKNLAAEPLLEVITEDRIPKIISALRDSINDLMDLAEPIQIYTNLLRGHGPLSRVKKALNAKSLLKLMPAENLLFEPNDTYIAIMGIAGSGKTTFISRCCGVARPEVGHSLISETQSINTYSFHLNKQRVHLIDTPGFDDIRKVDIDVLKDFAYWLTVSYKVRKIKLTGIVYLHRITDVRMTGTALANIGIFRSLVGKQSMSSVIIATTMWDRVSLKDGERRESELIAEYWGDMMREGAMVYRHTDDYDSATSIISNLISRHTTTVLSLQEEMVDNEKPLSDTTTGIFINKHLIKQEELLQHRLQDGRREIADVMAHRDHRDKKLTDEILEEQNFLQKEIIEMKTSRHEIIVTMEKLIQEKEEQNQKELAKINEILKVQQTQTQNKDTQLAQERNRMEYLLTQQALSIRAQLVQNINQQRQLQANLEQANLDQAALSQQLDRYQQADYEMAMQSNQRTGFSLDTGAMISMACAGLCCVM